MKELFPGISQWSWFSQEKGYDFNGLVLTKGNVRVMVDPPPLSQEDEALLLKKGPLTSIVITNRDHVRESDRYRNLFRTKIVMHELDAPLVEIRVDGIFRDSETLPGGIAVIHIPHCKSPGESAFLLPQGKGILIIGDALIGNPPGTLNLLPPHLFADVGKTREGIRTLLSYDYDAVLVGDGVSILTEGKQAITQFLEG